MILAHDKLVKEEWSHEHCEGYPCVNGLSTDSMKQVLDNALSVLTYELTVWDKDINPENFHIMKNEKNNHPECFHRWKFPQELMVIVSEQTYHPNHWIHQSLFQFPSLKFMT